MLSKDRQTIQTMFARIAPRYDRANHILSMRLDRRWRRHLAGTLRNSPGLVLDLAAGTGDLSVDLITLGSHRVISADFTFEMLAEGRRKVGHYGKQCSQLAADALSLPFRSGSFDAVTVAFGVRNFADPGRGLTEILRVTKSAGSIAILEFSSPPKFLNLFYRFYFQRILPRLGGMITGSRDPYEYLPHSVDEFPQGDAFVDLLSHAGFEQTSARRLSGGIVTLYRGVKP